MKMFPFSLIVPLLLLAVNINPIADASSDENAEPGKPGVAVETSVYIPESSSSVVNFQESTIMNADDVSTDPEIKSQKFFLQNPKIKPPEKKATGKERIWEQHYHPAGTSVISS